MEFDALKELLTDLGLEWQEGGDESIFVMAVRGDGAEMPVLIKPGEEIELLSSIGSLPALGSKPIEATMRQLAAAMGCQFLFGPSIEEGQGRQVVLECRLPEETAWATAEMTRQFELASRFLVLLSNPGDPAPGGE